MLGGLELTKCVHLKKVSKISAIRRRGKKRGKKKEKEKKEKKKV
jgi:hypothetical protein